MLSPQIHVPTLSLAMIGGFALLVSQIAFSGWRMLPRREALSWLAVCAALLVSASLFALRDYLPEWALVLTSHTALGVGLLAMVMATLQLLGVPPRRPVVTAAFAVYVAAVLGSLPLPLPAQISLTNGVAAAFLAPLALTALRHGWPIGRAVRGMTLALLVLNAVLVWRAVDASLNPRDYLNLSTREFAPLGHGLSMLLLMLAVLGVCFGYVLAAQERAQRKLHNLARRDPLTGCRNRRRLDEIMTAELARLQRHGATLSFLLVDLDDFKSLNDVHGHALGDAALVHVSRLLRRRLRTTDKLARMGGEEFGIVLPGTDATGARRVAEQLREALHSHPLPLPEGGERLLTASIGMTTLPSGSQATPIAVYSAADRAMYEAKRSGKDRAKHSDWVDL